MAKIYENHPWLKTLEGVVDLDIDTLYELQDHFGDDNPLDIDESEIYLDDIRKHFDSVIIVDNVPVVPVSKLSKVKSMLRVVFSPCGKFFAGFLDSEDTGIHVPLNADGDLTVGFALIHFTTPREALKAVKLLDNYRLDNKHTFRVNLYSDFEGINEDSGKYKPPEEIVVGDEDYALIEDRYSWLHDEFMRNQFSLRFDSETEIHWAEGIALDGQTTVAYGGEREKSSGKVWTEMGTMWSPQGTFFVTFHSQGICLWAGKTFERTHRFSHAGVVDLIFSPDEGKMITWNGNTDPDDASALILWDIESSQMLRALPFLSTESELADQFAFPFQFSPDSAYFARAIRNGISVYDSVTGRLVNKPIKTKGIVAFKWSPSDNLIAFWSPEEEPLPAGVAVIDPIKQTTLKRKNLFNVREVTLHWHNKGDFLSAEVIRTKKKSKNTYAGLEIFRMRGVNIPVETLEMKENSMHFSWEPSGLRFCIILHNHVTNVLSQCFYTTNKVTGSNVELVTKLQNNFRQVSWSPAGNSLIMHNFKKGEPSIQFYNMDEQVVTAEGEHFAGRDIQWDPSGRIVATIAHHNLFGETQARDTLENGWHLWSFQGRLLQKNSMSKLYQFKWRPVPQQIDGSLLWTETEEKVLNGNLKTYIKKYANQGELKRKRLEIAANAEKLKMLKEFRKLMDSKREAEEHVFQERIRLSYTLSLNDEVYETKEAQHDELLSEKREVVK